MPKDKPPEDAPAHAVLSPSASSRWIPCPGSIAASAVVPQKPAGKYAAQGTAAHSLLEMCLRLEQRPHRFLGHEIEQDFVVDEDMADAVDAAMDFVTEEMRANPKLRLHIESRVKIGPLIGLDNGELEGTADIILEDGRICIVADYKHGAGVYVDIKGNTQLRLYAAGARHKLGRPYFKYRTVIIQPRLYSNNGNPIRDEYFPEKDLVDWLKGTVRPSAHAALTPNAPRRPGDWCRWCPANGRCREFATFAASTAAREFGEIDPLKDKL